jgi:hypothetical protein
MNDISFSTSVSKQIFGWRSKDRNGNRWLIKKSTFRKTFSVCRRLNVTFNAEFLALGMFESVTCYYLLLRSFTNNLGPERKAHVNSLKFSHKLLRTEWTTNKSKGCNAMRLLINLLHAYSCVWQAIRSTVRQS